MLREVQECLRSGRDSQTVEVDHVLVSQQLRMDVELRALRQDASREKHNMRSRGGIDGRVERAAAVRWLNAASGGSTVASSRSRSRWSIASSSRTTRSWANRRNPGPRSFLRL